MKISARNQFKGTVISASAACWLSSDQPQRRTVTVWRQRFWAGAEALAQYFGISMAGEGRRGRFQNVTIVMLPAEQSRRPVQTPRLPQRKTALQPIPIRTCAPCGQIMCRIPLRAGFG